MQRNKLLKDLHKYEPVAISTSVLNSWDFSVYYFHSFQHPLPAQNLDP